MRTLLISSIVLLTGCGAAGRAVIDTVVAIQSHAAVQSERRHNPCDGIRNARLNFDDAFSQAMISVNSTIESSSKCLRKRAKRSSETSRPVIVMASAYSRAVRSASAKKGEFAYSLIAKSFSGGTPSSLPTAALMSCQKGQPLRKATRRLTIAASLPSTSPDASRPFHIARTPRKIEGLRAYMRWFRSGAPHLFACAARTVLIGSCSI